MNIEKVLADLDVLFRENRLGEIEKFLLDNEQAAVDAGDSGARLSILNELMGFYREMTQYEKACETSMKALDVAKMAGLQGSVAYATTLLNSANAYRAAGRFDESLEAYDKAEVIYKKELSEDDFGWASFYNNKSLLFQAQDRYEDALACLKSALVIVKKHSDAMVELAVTYTNMGQVAIKIGKFDLAEEYLLEAEKIFVKVGKGDYHYCGCANALGMLYYGRKQFEKAIKYYEEALLNIYETAGFTENYRAIRENLMAAYQKGGEPIYDNMLDLCQAYYEKYGKLMIEEKFPEYVGQIAVGLCGEGSECFGFEDEISTDHDCGSGFAMWITRDVYEKIGGKLQEEYEKLPRVFAGYIRRETVAGSGRCGVVIIEDFYKRVLGGKSIPYTEKEWLSVDEFALAAAVNGRVFVDELGEFSGIRTYLQQYYPKNVWLSRVAKTLIKCAQTGQYNYGRCMARGDYVAAQIALSQYMQNVMELVFLLNKRYAPYYKWQQKAMVTLEILPEVGDILKAICDMPSQRGAWGNYRYDGKVNEQDMIAMTIEIVAKLVVHRLQEMGLSKSDDLYLEAQAREVIKNMESLVEKIVRLEWEAFDKVQNEGGRADCQDDWETFSIMRKSQYMTWPEEMLCEIIRHFEESAAQGRNLITEKYGRMMETTVPWEYERIKEAFPALSDEQKAIIESIVEIQVKWMEEFAQKYPKMAGNARSIRTSEDRVFNTSYETYLRGELGTYSEHLLIMYGRFVAEIARKGGNLAQMTMENTAHFYGYANLAEAENKN